jgi:hypothetical protein
VVEAGSRTFQPSVGQVRVGAQGGRELTQGERVVAHRLIGSPPLEQQAVAVWVLVERGIEAVQRARPALASRQLIGGRDRGYGLIHLILLPLAIDHVAGDDEKQD